MYKPEKIGTPLLPNAVKVMLLGSGELGKEVAIAFQRLGVEVHAVDRYDNAPAHQVAHFSHVIDMTDPVAVRKTITEVKPDFVIPEIEALATDELVKIEEEGLATIVPTARAAKLTMNREGIRRLAAEELGLPTSGYEFCSTFEEYQEASERLGYPNVVKPVMSSSGKGQSVVKSAEDLEAAWEYAMSGARVANQRVIVEQFVEFDYEITLLTVRGINPATGKVATWFCEPIGHRQEDGDYVESWQPMEMNERALDNSRSVAARITNALGGRGVFGVELFVSGDDVYFSEVSPRPHDTGLVTLASQRFSEFELHAKAILGLPVDVTLISPGASAVIYGGLESQEVSYSGLAEALAVEETDVRLFAKPEAFAKRRMGVAVSTAEDTDTARERATRAAAAVTVHGAE